jgi:hypothetical protein
LRERPRFSFAKLFGEKRRECLDERHVHARVARHQIAAVAVVGAGERADAAARLGDQQVAGCRVPGREADLPETVETAGACA